LWDLEVLVLLKTQVPIGENDGSVFFGTILCVVAGTSRRSGVTADERIIGVLLVVLEATQVAGGSKVVVEDHFSAKLGETCKHFWPNIG
jgi:hypothetical protein